jgi:uncharacterized SAM-binding protein YcdF (DUF218 family)
MFFFLSKFLAFLINPVFWIVLLLVWSFYTKKERRRKVLRIIAVGIFIICTNQFFTNLAVRSWQVERNALPAGKTYDAAILLGGISMMDKNGDGYFEKEADRFIQATRLYKTGTVKNIAMAGGSPSMFKTQRPEADFIVEELTAQGVPLQNIIAENNSRNTFENASFVLQKLNLMKLKPPYLLVTSALHMRRALAVFRKQGVEVLAYPAAFTEVDYKRSFWDYIIPDTELLVKWKKLLKEIAGYIIYKTTGKA